MIGSDDMLRELYYLTLKKCKLQKIRKAMHMNKNCLGELDSLMRAIGIDCSSFEIVDVTQLYNYYKNENVRP